jgi:hypothetical protein
MCSTVVDGDGKSALGVGDDAVRHLSGSKAGVAPDHADDGDINFRENVDRGAQDGDGRKDDDEQSHHHERVRTPKR